MTSAFMRRLSIPLVGILPIFFWFLILPSRAASALAAWSIGENGVLLLRTKKNADLKAFFQNSDFQRGQRVWIDFPGELTRPRTLKGSGPIREIRLGKPRSGFTRLVVEFRPGVALDPSRLQLKAVSEDRWELAFKELPTYGLLRIGEGTSEIHKIIIANSLYKRGLKSLIE